MIYATGVSGIKPPMPAQIAAHLGKRLWTNGILCLVLVAFTGCVISPRRVSSGTTSNGNTNSEFTMSANPNPQSVALGNLAIYNVNVVAENGFTGTVNLAVNSAPSSVAASLSQGSITGGTGTVALSVQTFSTSTLGNAIITLNGTDPNSGQSQTITVTLTITN